MLGDHQSAGVLLRRKQRWLLQVLPFGHQQFDGIPGGEFLLRCSSDSGGDNASAIAAARPSSDTAPTSTPARCSKCANYVELTGELRDLLDAELDT